MTKIDKLINADARHNNVQLRKDTTLEKAYHIGLDIVVFQDNLLCNKDFMLDKMALAINNN